ncbi:hypothetical protein ACHBTE_30860 [Streptomyces sp. M41]|uniref:hypothetical protein n=1 Tax=Streptomyces sp. M41 TaxID=3059412 RepID=UPI00374CAE72
MHDLTSDRIRARLIEYPAGPATAEERRELNKRRFAMVEAEIDRRLQGGKATDASWATPAMSAQGIVRTAFQTMRFLSDEAVIRLIAMSQMLWAKFGSPTSTITATVTTTDPITAKTTTRKTRETCDHVDDKAPLHTRARRKDGNGMNSQLSNDEDVVTDGPNGTVLAG